MGQWNDGDAGAVFHMASNQWNDGDGRASFRVIPLNGMMTRLNLNFITTRALQRKDHIAFVSTSHLTCFNKKEDGIRLLNQEHFHLGEKTFSQKNVSLLFREHI